MGSETYISKERVIEYLESEGVKQRELHLKASNIRNKRLSRKVYFRGLIEFSNICKNDCIYCGIRRSNDKIKRYFMTKEEILKAVQFCDKAKYGSIVLQSGEQRNKEFTDFVEDVASLAHKKFPNIGITLCVGEQTKKIYAKFFNAGASRYLLRIETSNKKHYGKLHPKQMSFNNRKKCLTHLKDIGFQVGTGVMIGSPFQTIENLAGDLLFFKESEADMIGMGPYIPHNNILFRNAHFDMSEIAKGAHSFASAESKPAISEHAQEHAPRFSAAVLDKSKQLNLSLNMIATLRLMAPDINIASTTALQALHPNGREMGLLAGANVIMPLATPPKYRKNYQLYNNKPCVDESSEECMGCLTNRIKSVGLIPAFGEKGTSLHYLRRVRWQS